jgi:hypothetical protein
MQHLQVISSIPSRCTVLYRTFPFHVFRMIQHFQIFLALIAKMKAMNVFLSVFTIANAACSPLAGCCDKLHDTFGPVNLVSSGILFDYPSYMYIF